MTARRERVPGVVETQVALRDGVVGGGNVIEEGKGGKNKHKGIMGAGFPCDKPPTRTLSF